MAQPFTLKIGSVDLSNYVRLAPGEGFDPVGAGGFLTPSFVDAPIAEGQLLTNVDFGTREIAWPLHLSDVSKDAVHALIRSINNEVANNPQLRVEWKDQGATNSTFFEVAFARLDPEYDYRKAALNYESGTLHVWCSPPLGHTGTTKVIGGGATQIASIPVGIIPVTTLTGDAKAQAVWSMQGNGAHGVGVMREVAAVAVLPHPSYQGWYPAGSLAVPSISMVGATWAFASQVLVGAIPSGVAFNTRVGRLGIAPIPSSGAYSNRNRLFGIVSVMAPSSKLSDLKAYATAPIYFSAVDDRGSLLGPTAVAIGLNSSTGAVSMCTYPVLQVIDLGVFSMPSYMPSAAITITAGASLGAAASYAFNALVMMPDETMTYIDLSFTATAAKSRNSVIFFDGTPPDDVCWGNYSYQDYTFTTGSVFNANFTADSARRGAVPKIMPAATAAFMTFHLMQPLCTSPTPGAAPGAIDSADIWARHSIAISARERFQFAR